MATLKQDTRKNRAATAEQVPETDRSQASADQEPVEQVSVVMVSCNRVDCVAHEPVGAPGRDGESGHADQSWSTMARGMAVRHSIPNFRLPSSSGCRRTSASRRRLNIGIRAADGSYVLFLHEDVEIKPETVDLLRAELEQRSETGAACPLLLDDSGSPALQVRDLPSPTNPDPPFRTGKPGEAAAVAGAAIMVRRFLLDAMRRIDERYGNYGSDVELSMQVRRANKRIVIVEGATAIHRPEVQEQRAEFAADRQLGTATYLGKYFGFPAKLKYLIVSILAALFTFKLGQLRFLLSGQKIDGA